MKAAMTAALMAASMAYGNAYAQEPGESETTTEEPPAQSEQSSLENDMSQGHARVLESAPAEQGATPMVQSSKSSSVEDDRPTRREGTTFEFGLGLHYTSEYIDSEHRLGGAFGASFGWFLNNDTALLLRFVASSLAQNQREVVFAAGEDRNADRFHGISTFFLGPQLQFFPHDRFMVAAGVGLATTLETVRLSVDGTTEGDAHHSTAMAGVGASLRTGVTVYQRKDKAALRIGLEAVPTYIDKSWNITTGLVGELQIF